jgi:hypothetical protein
LPQAAMLGWSALLVAFIFACVAADYVLVEKQWMSPSCDGAPSYILWLDMWAEVVLD